MPDRALVFSPSSVRALQAGFVTQTRRIAETREARLWPGEQVWVREGYRIDSDGRVFYRADTPLGKGAYWRAPQSMERIHSRLLLEIVSVERAPLHAIDHAGIEAEGVVAYNTETMRRVHGWSRQDIAGGVVEAWPHYAWPDRTRYWLQDLPVPYFRSPEHAYQSAWRDNNTHRASWDDNPIVWVIGFELVRAPSVARAIDTQEAAR